MAYGWREGEGNPTGSLAVRCGAVRTAALRRLRRFFHRRSARASRSEKPYVYLIKVLLLSSPAALRPPPGVGAARGCAAGTASGHRSRTGAEATHRTARPDSATRHGPAEPRPPERLRQWATSSRAAPPTREAKRAARRRQPIKEAGRASCHWGGVNVGQEPIGKRAAPHHLHTPRVPANPLPPGGGARLRSGSFRRGRFRRCPREARCRPARPSPRGPPGAAAVGRPKSALLPAGPAPGRGRGTRPTPVGRGGREGGGWLRRKTGKGRRPRRSTRSSGRDLTARRSVTGRCSCRSSAARGGWGAAPTGRARAAATTGRRAPAAARHRRG